MLKQIGPSFLRRILAGEGSEAVNVKTIVVQPISQPFPDAYPAPADILTLGKELFKLGYSVVSMTQGRNDSELLEKIRSAIGERAWCALSGEEYAPNPFNADPPSDEFLNLLEQPTD